jgi:hypothetical protein
MIQFNVLEGQEFTWLFVEARRGKPDRADLLRLDLPQVTGSKGLVISSGKLPAWAGVGTAISHYRNRTPWQAIYDPVEKGAIVIFSISDNPLIGDILSLKLPCLACAEKGIETLLKAGAMYPYCQKNGHQNHAPERQSYTPKNSPLSKDG